MGVNDQLHIGLGKTDAWDDSIPTGCPDKTPYFVPGTGTQLDCFDGLRNFNQVRPAVFDGGYAFGRVAGQAELPMLIGAEGKGTYIIEAVAPPGYLHQGNGDKNVVFGDALQASTAALPFECVGMELDVPAFLTLFPGESNSNYDAGQRKWRKCDMKAVPLVPAATPHPTSTCSPRRRSRATAWVSSSMTPPPSSTTSRPTSARSTRPRTCRCRSRTGRAANSLASIRTSSARTTSWCPRASRSPAVPVGRDAEHDRGVHEPSRPITDPNDPTKKSSTRISTAGTRSSATRFSTCRQDDLP